MKWCRIASCWKCPIKGRFRDMKNGKATIPDRPGDTLGYAKCRQLLGDIVKIEVLECDWGEGRRNDIRVLLEDVASHIVHELRDPIDGTIRVMNLPGNPPRTFFRRPGETAYEVNLTAKDRRWSQFAYQFGHEFCHVLSGHDRLRCSPNNWFHESLCELSSFFVLHRMAERWPTDPPYSNWANYSASLAEYAEATARKYREATPTGNFHEWLVANEDSMRDDPYLREQNGVVALRLLPLFEETPKGWNAVRHLPVSSGQIGEYIEAWSAEVQAADRLFVERVGEVLLD